MIDATKMLVGIGWLLICMVCWVVAGSLLGVCLIETSVLYLGYKMFRDNLTNKSLMTLN